MSSYAAGAPKTVLKKSDGSDWVDGVERTTAEVAETPKAKVIAGSADGSRQEFIQNQRTRFDGAVVRVRRAEIKRDTTQAARMHYDLCYREMERQAESFCTCLPEGAELDIPAYLPPAAQTEKTVKIRARVEVPSPAPIRRGEPPKPGVPGTIAAEVYDNFQGGKK